MIRVGVISRTICGASTTNWIEAHSILRLKDGSFVVYGLDDQRTPWFVKAKDFAGVLPSA